MELAGNAYIDKWRLKMICFDEIIGIEESEGRSGWNTKVDKNGRFYHVTQRAANREFIFDKELGQYRHNLLCRICSRLNVKIVFSVTMSNHTHDVLIAKKWKDIAQALRLVNTSVSRKLKRKYPNKYRNGRKVFESRPHYRVIKNIVDLTTVGKYDYDNVKNVQDKGEFVPYSCFWMFEKGLATKPYDKNIYPRLFGITEKELCEFYRDNDSKAVYKAAREMFRDWTKKDNDNLFKADPSLPWQDEK